MYLRVTLYHSESPARTSAGFLESVDNDVHDYNGHKIIKITQIWLRFLLHFLREQLGGVLAGKTQSA